MKPKRSEPLRLAVLRSRQEVDSFRFENTFRDNCKECIVLMTQDYRGLGTPVPRAEPDARGPGMASHPGREETSGAFFLLAQ